MAADVFYGDVPTADAMAAVAALVPSTARTFQEPSGYPAFRQRPSTYVACRKDGAITPDNQQRMAQRAGSSLVELNSSHSPFLSMPDAVADVLIELARATR